MVQPERSPDIGTEFWDLVFRRDLFLRRDRRSLLAISKDAGIPYASLRRWVTRLELPPNELAARKIGKACGLTDEEVLALYDRAELLRSSGSVNPGKRYRQRRRAA
jgi:hypothetical protein